MFALLSSVCSMFDKILEIGHTSLLTNEEELE